MDYRNTERFLVRMAEMQPRVPEWCKAENMEITVPQKELWRYESRKHDSIMHRIIQLIFGRKKRKEATP